MLRIVLFVNPAQQLDQFVGFLLGEARFKPLLVLPNRPLGRKQCLASRSGEVQGLLASVGLGFAASDRRVILSIDDGHGGGGPSACVARDRPGLYRDDPTSQSMDTCFCVSSMCANLSVKCR